MLLLHVDVTPARCYAVTGNRVDRVTAQRLGQWPICARPQCGCECKTLSLHFQAKALMAAWAWTWLA